MADRRSYNAVLRGLKRSFGLNQAQARVAWRGIQARLDRTPRVADLKRHPRITAQEVKRAPAKERAIRAAKTRAEKKAKAAPPVKVPPKRPARKPPKAAAAGAPAPPQKIPPEFEEIDRFFGGEDFEDEERY
jgi:hypothetical protein